MAFDNEEYCNSQSGASLTRPEQCGKLRIGGHIVISGKPCKIMEMTKAKNGKHGSAKAHIIALDIFTDKKIEIIR
jgi:translation initiation factor 5A